MTRRLGGHQCEAVKQKFPSPEFGTPVIILRLEALCAFVASVLAYHRFGFNWWHFGLLFFLPDLSILGYIYGKKVGAALYNIGHTYAVAVPFGAVFWFADNQLGMAAGLVWIAHIGFDRCLGYGLKHASGFGDTHLGRTGRTRGQLNS